MRRRPKPRFDSAQLASRRAFLGHGFQLTAGALMLPSLPALVGLQRAWGATCPAPGAGTGRFVAHIHLDGGAGTNAFAQPFLAGRAPVANANRGVLGHAPGSTYQQVGRGSPLQVGVGFLEGLTTAIADTGANAALTSALADVRVLTCAHNSNDDTDSNLKDLSALFASLPGYAGSSLGLIGDDSRHRLVLPSNAPFSPVRVNSIGGLRNLVATPTIGGVTQAMSQKLWDFLQGVSPSQLERISGSDMISGADYAQAIECGVGTNLGNAAVSLANQVDARSAVYRDRSGADVSASFRGIWGVAAGGADNRNSTLASLVGTAATGVSQGMLARLGGYDYHGENKASTDAKNLAVGLLVRNVVATARLLGVELVLYLATDGNIGWANQSANSDRGSGSVSCIVYLPAAGAAVPAARDILPTYGQLGYFNGDPNPVSQRTGVGSVSTDQVSSLVLAAAAGYLVSGEAGITEVLAYSDGNGGSLTRSQLLDILRPAFPGLA